MEQLDPIALAAAGHLSESAPAPGMPVSSHLVEVLTKAEALAVCCVAVVAFAAAFFGERHRLRQEATPA